MPVRKKGNNGILNGRVIGIGIGVVVLRACPLSACDRGISSNGTYATIDENIHIPTVTNRIK